MGHATGGVGNGVSEDIVGGGNTGAIGQAIGVAGIAESGLILSRPLAVVAIAISRVSVSVRFIVGVGTRVSIDIGDIVSIVGVICSPSLGLSISRPLAIVTIAIGVGYIGSISVGVRAYIAVVSVVSIGISLSFGGSKENNCDSLEKKFYQREIFPKYH